MSDCEAWMASSPRPVSWVRFGKIRRGCWEQGEKLPQTAYGNIHVEKITKLSLNGETPMGYKPTNPDFHSPPLWDIVYRLLFDENQVLGRFYNRIKANSGELPAAAPLPAGGGVTSRGRRGASPAPRSILRPTEHRNAAATPSCKKEFGALFISFFFCKEPKYSLKWPLSGS